MPHRAFGLVLAADAPLPGLPPAEAGARADLRVHLGALPPWPGLGTSFSEGDAPADDGEEGLEVRRVPEGRLLRYADGTRFALDGAGREIWAAWAPPVTLDDVAVYLLGPVLGLAMRLRGLLALHASAVDVGGRALLLVGGEGAGKSTTAAAFARAGFPVLADDVAALDEADGAFRVRPAAPRLRLWSDAAAALHGDADALPRLAAGWDKRGMDVAPAAGPLPVAAVYLLAPRDEGGDEPRIHPVPPAGAVMALVPHAFAASVLDAPARGRELQALGRLARAVPLRRVSAPEALDRLPALVTALARDAHRLHPHAR